MVDYPTACGAAMGLPLAEAAQVYARDFGWHVFPVVPLQKTPAVKRWQDVASREPGQVAEWWERWPKANVGVFLKKSGLFVVDIDPRNGGEPMDEWRYFVENPAEYPRTLTARSAGGGWHHYFPAKEGARYPDKFTEGVDLKHNGYALLAPSVVEQSQYEWLHCWPVEESRLIDKGVGSHEWAAYLMGWDTGPLTPRSRVRFSPPRPESQRQQFMSEIGRLRWQAGMTEDKAVAALWAFKRQQGIEDLRRDQPWTSEHFRWMWRSTEGWEKADDYAPADALRLVKEWTA